MSEILTGLIRWSLVVAGTSILVALAGIAIGYVHLKRRDSPSEGDL